MENTPEKAVVAVVEAESTPEKSSPTVSPKAKGKSKATSSSPEQLHLGDGLEGQLI